MQYYDRLQRCIHRHKVFLVIDNVFDNLKKIEQAKQYLRAEYAPGSIVLVTASSISILQELNIEERSCFEMPKLEEEEARSLFLYHAAPDYDYKAHEELLEQCMGSVKQFFVGPGADDNKNYHYHPVALKKFGVQLGYHPEQWGEKLNKWPCVDHTEFFPKSFDMLIPNSQVSFLRKSFDKLVFRDQLLLMDAALFYPEPPEHGSTLKQLNVFKWLSLVHEEQFADDVIFRVSHLHA